MRIHSLASLIAFPFILIAGIILYLLFFENRESLYLYLFPPVIVLAVIYSFSPKINFWWHKKYPPLLDHKLKLLVENSSVFYSNLDDVQKQKFRDRLSIFIHHKSFSIMQKEKEDMPIDVRTLLGINGITLSFHRPDYFYDKYDYFIGYNHPFPSPKMQFLHNVETDHEDGTLVFNLHTLYERMILKTGHFNIGLMAFADLFKHSYPHTRFPDISYDGLDREAVRRIGNAGFEQIVATIGYEPEDINLILIPLYFEYPEAFGRELPGISAEYSAIFSS